MSKKSMNVLLLAKIQPTAGTDPVPVPATNAILASEPKVNILNAQIIKRSNIFSFMGNQGSVIATVYATCEFDVEMQSSGTAGTAPAFGPLLRGCAFAETLVAVTSAAYNPISAVHELITFYYYLDGIRHIMTDARGSVSFTINARGIPMMHFKFTGFYATPTDNVGTAPTYTAFKAPVAVNKVNTPTFTLHGFAAKVSQFGFDINNQVEYRNLIGSEEIVITNREPSASILMELPDTVATKDWWTSVRNGVTGAISLIHGVGAGKITTIAAPVAQLTDLNYSDEQGVVMIQSNIDIQPSVGNDEVVITFT